MVLNVQVRMIEYWIRKSRDRGEKSKFKKKELQSWFKTKKSLHLAMEGLRPLNHLGRGEPKRKVRGQNKKILR